MLNVNRTTGSIADVIASMRDVPARLVPYAASSALTRTAQIAATKDLPDAMRAAFVNPTPFTLNSLFVKPSTVETLSARVMVKDTTSRGVVPEKFLFPEVAGGARGEKGFERALRYGGWLKSGESVIPTDNMPRDAFGNVSGPAIRGILSTLGKPGGGGGRGKRTRGKFGTGLFAGQIGATRGIWRREGRSITLLFVFTTRQPLYRERLDFNGIVANTANTHYKAEFGRAWDGMRARGMA